MVEVEAQDTDTSTDDDNDTEDSSTATSSDLESTIPSDDIIADQEYIKNTFHDVLFGRDFPKLNKQLWCTVPIIFVKIGYGMMVQSVLPFIQSNILVITDEGIHNLVLVVFVIGIVTSCIVMSNRGRQKVILLVTVTILICWYMWILPANKLLHTMTFLLTYMTTTVSLNANLVYITEVMEPELRGFFLALITLSRVFGSLLAEGIGSEYTFFWPIIIGIYVVFPTLSLLTASAIPESPIWLLVRGREQIAKKEVTWMHGISEETEIELQSLSDYAQKTVEKSKRGTMRKIFSKTFMKPLLILFVMHSMRISAGYGIVMAYAVHKTYFRVLNETYGDEMMAAHGALQTSFITDSAEMVSTAVLVFLIVRFRRRVLLIVSAWITILSLFILIASTYYDLDAASNMAIYLVYIIVINLGLNSIPYFMSAEYFPQTLREYGSGFILVYNHMMDTFVESLFEIRKPDIHGYDINSDRSLFWKLLLINLLLSTILFLTMPDTDTLTLQQVEEEIEKGPWIRSPRRLLFGEPATAAAGTTT